MSSDDVMRLERMKKEIEQAKQNKAKCEGVISQLLDQLKNDFKLSCMEDIEGKLSELGKDIENLKTLLETNMKEIDSLWIKTTGGE